MTDSIPVLPALLGRNSGEVLEDWLREQLSGGQLRTDLVTEAQLRQQAGEFLRRFQAAVESGDLEETRTAPWEAVREVLSAISRERAQQGFSPTETATFVFSLKGPLFVLLRRELEQDPQGLADAIWQVTRVLDRLGLFTLEVFLKSREDVIQRQQQELLELSTPVVKLWDGVVAVPLIGTLDSARTQVVMENLLQKIVETGARVAIIDITGVPTVDTLVAQHLMKTVAAARLMGAECIISGIRPQIAQTIVHLGVVLENASTKATLADAISLALRQTGFTVSRTVSPSQGQG